MFGALFASPVFLIAFSTGPPPLRTGAAADGGINCTACHRSFDVNSDPRGRVVITAFNYTPGVKQTVRVRVEHPEARRWGFELTARLVNDPGRQAGAFTPSRDQRRVCSNNQAGPCNNLTEFVTHTHPADSSFDSTSPGTVGGNTWEIEWTPPATNEGAVIFYAAGNAADNSGSNTGDRIFTTSLTIGASAPGGIRPSITRGGVVEASWDAAIQGGNLPTQLNGVSVMVNNRPATISFASPGQVNALAPIDDTVGDVQVVLTNGGASSEALVVRKAAAAPA